MDNTAMPSKGQKETAAATAAATTAAATTTAGTATAASAATTITSLDLMHTLPPEVYLAILLRLDTASLQRAAQTCRHWRTTIEETDWLWRKFCHLRCDPATLVEIRRDRGLGYSWKDSFIRTCSPHSIKRKWFNGEFSKLSVYDKHLPPFMCRMDVETWGQILELELSR